MAFKELIDLPKSYTTHIYERLSNESKIFFDEKGIKADKDLYDDDWTEWPKEIKREIINIIKKIDETPIIDRLSDETRQFVMSKGILTDDDLFDFKLGGLSQEIKKEIMSAVRAVMKDVK
jgi:hypothetical protein